MRIISNDELEAVSGGKESADGGGDDAFLSWLDGAWDSISSWFGGGGSGGGGTENIQTITIRASRMSDAEAIAYDIQEGIKLAPTCEFTYVINPTAVTVGLSATASVAPSGTASGSRTTTTATRSWKCPPK